MVIASTYIVLSVVYAFVHILPVAYYWEWRRRDNLVLLIGDLVLLVGERKREFGAAGWCCLIVVVYFKV